MSKDLTVSQADTLRIVRDELPKWDAWPNYPYSSQPAPAENDIRAICAKIADMLVAKNRSYGNSALEPIRVFSKASATEQLRVRLDDKLSRIVRGHEFLDENTRHDLIGYLLLLDIAERREREARG